ncbi:MAG: tetratricopeptide repeat protein [Bacteroidetes bacterium]|nr:tetratricopeptide repeat protein [Bacteroidota bacterium]
MEVPAPGAASPTPAPPNRNSNRRLQWLVLSLGACLLLILGFTERKALVSKVPEETPAAAATPSAQAPEAAASSTALPVFTELEPLAAGSEAANVLPKLQQKLAEAPRRADSLQILQNLVAASNNLQRKDYAALYQHQLWLLAQDPRDLLTAAELMTEARDLYQMLQSRQPVARRFNSQAIRLYDHYLQQKPNDTEAQAGKYICMVHSDTPMEGITSLRSLVETPGIPAKTVFRGSKELGIFSLQTGQLDKAIERFKVCTQVAPDNFEGYYLMGTALKMQNKSDEARPFLKKALSLSPDPKIQRQIANDIENLNAPAHQH